MTSPDTKAVRKPHPAALSMLIRKLHTYVGMLIAPTVIFMAATGVIQIYGLHEAHPGYAPAPVIEKLGMVHKNQVYAAGRHGPPAGAQPAGGAPGGGPAGAREEHEQKPATALLKAFFAVASIGLIFSTGTGVWLALQQRPRRKTYALLLLVGALVPVILAALSA
jgi:hypothetical protein